MDITAINRSKKCNRYPTKEEDNNIYEIVGVKDGKAVTYQSGTIEKICDDELLNEYGFEKHDTINDVLRDMDGFGEYKHYAKKLTKTREKK